MAVPLLAFKLAQECDKMMTQDGKICAKQSCPATANLLPLDP